jgi:phage terminase small subunit
VTPIQRRFVREYVVDLNGQEAAIRAGSRAKQAKTVASDWLAIPEVKMAVAIEIEKRNRKVDARAEDVIRGLVNTVRADPRKLVELRRTCCRCCHGWEHEYQRTEGEMRRARESHAAAMAVLPAEKRVPFNEAGGTGWDPRRDPHEDCTECFGEGVVEPRFADTRDLDAESAALYRGVKRTKDGLEMLLADQDKARDQLARHLGLFKDKLELSGKLSWERVLANVDAAQGDGL